MSDNVRAEESRSRPDRARLFRVAARQHGYFTADQADACGYSAALLSYHHSQSRRFIRLRRGLYRLREFPVSPREAVMAAWLAIGKHIATVSHTTALYVQGLIDEAPSAVHITIPRSRRSLTSTRGIRIHTVTSPLPKSNLTICDGLIVTTAVRSIVDTADAGGSLADLRLATGKAIDRGLATATDIEALAAQRSRRVARLIGRSLTEAQVLHRADDRRTRGEPGPPVVKAKI